MAEPILLVSNSRDLAVDSIVDELRHRGEDYLRLDLDMLSLDQVVLEPIDGLLQYRLSDGIERVVSNPKSILYRAPTHLRESSGHRYTPDGLLSRHQWAAFARSLVVFPNAVWVNHPVATYAAENKPHQLQSARIEGFATPRTSVANCPRGAPFESETVIVKALDSFLLRREENDHFFYTTRVRGTSISAEECRDMPMIFQQVIEPKTDLRVTVVGDRCFPAETTEVVEGDWRLQKDKVHFQPVELPEDVQRNCVQLIRNLGLLYGAIDLARTEGTCYFLEINPTGEWSWLDDTFDSQISKALVDALVGH